MNRRVLGVLGGGLVNLDVLSRWAASADVIYAADCGADPLIEQGLMPIVVGDLDSIQNHQSLPNLKVIHDLSQDRTDCEKLLVQVAKEHKAITLIGVEGDQLDHVLGTLLSAAKAPLHVRLVLSRGLAWVVRGGELVEVPALRGARSSLIPLIRSEGVDYKGVQWELSSAEVSPTGLASISNKVAQDRVKVSVGQGAVLLSIEYPEQELPFW